MNLRLPNLHLSACALACASLVAACGGGDAGPPPDALAPTVSISSNASGTVKGDVTYTFTFSEDVGTSFTADDVTVTGGTKAASVTKASATSYTLVVTPTANTTGSIAVSVAASKFSDAANNANTAAASAPAVAFDTQAPTAQISSNAAGTATGPVILTFTFSEDVGTSFTAEDVTLTGGTKAAAVTKVNATTYTLVATPTAGASGNLTVAIAASAFSDIAGNANTAAPAQFSQAYNTVPSLSFASGYTQFKETAPGSNYYEGGTAEGGKIGFFNGGFNPDLVYNQTLFTGGGYTDQNPNPVPAADTFYYIAVTYSSAPSGGYLGAYSQYPGTGLQLEQQKTLRIDIAVDDGHFKQQTNKDFRVEITAGTTFNNGTCKPMVFRMVTPQQATMYTYRLPLAGFAVAQDCGQANLTAAQILAMPIKEVTALYAYPNLNDSTNVNQYGGRGTAITRGTTAFE
jgi:Bacterial Ig-like domain